MSLEKYSRSFVAQCDFCPDTHDTDEDEFQAAVDAIKREGCQSDSSDFEDST